jgi:hypothetical protein
MNASEETMISSIRTVLGVLLVHADAGATTVAAAIAVEVVRHA